MNLDWSWWASGGETNDRGTSRASFKLDKCQLSEGNLYRVGARCGQGVTTTGVELTFHFRAVIQVKMIHGRVSLREERKAEKQRQQCCKPFQHINHWLNLQAGKPKAKTPIRSRDNQDTII